MITIIKSLIIFIILISGLFLSGCREEKIKAEEIEGKEVSITSPKMLEKFEASIHEKGTVEPLKKKEIYSEISGFISKVPVKEGDSVAKGQELIIIKNPEIEKTLENSESLVNESEINISKAEENLKNLEEQNEINIIQIQMDLEEYERQLDQHIRDSENREIDFQRSINSMLSSLKQSQCDYDNIKSDSSAVSQKEINLKKKLIAKEEAEAELNRRKELFEAKVISKKQLEEAENGYNQSKLDYEQAVKDLEYIKSKWLRDLELVELRVKEWEYKVESEKEKYTATVILDKDKRVVMEEKVRKTQEKLAIYPSAHSLETNEADIDVAQEKLLRETNNYDLALKNYKKTRLLSPIPGTVTYIDPGMKEGREITPGALCVIVSDTKKLYIKTMIDNENISSIFIGQEVNITGNGISSGEALKGKILSISPEGKLEKFDKNKLKYEVLIDFKIPPDTIKPVTDMVMDIEFVSTVKKNILTVPSGAVVERQNKTFIFLYNNGKADEVEVKTGIADKDYIEILSGITEKDQIITDWKGDLTEGTPVNIK